MAKNLIPKLIEEKNITRYRLMKKTGLSWATINSLIEAKELPDRTNLATLKILRDALGLNCIDDLEEEEKS